MEDVIKIVWMNGKTEIIYEPHTTNGQTPAEAITYNWDLARDEGLWMFLGKWDRHNDQSKGRIDGDDLWQNLQIYCPYERIQIFSENDWKYGDRIGKKGDPEDSDTHGIWQVYYRGSLMLQRIVANKLIDSSFSKSVDDLIQVQPLYTLENAMNIERNDTNASSDVVNTIYKIAVWLEKVAGMSSDADKKLADYLNIDKTAIELARHRAKILPPDKRDEQAVENYIGDKRTKHTNNAPTDNTEERQNLYSDSCSQLNNTLDNPRIIEGLLNITKNSEQDDA